MFTASSLSAIPQLLFVLGTMVVVHEFGHFLAAKLCGVRVEAFAVGFGKRLIGYVHNGTDYRLNLLPLGGYVKMAGELPGETVHSDDPGEFQNHPRWQRVLIALAGPIANFILAFCLLTGLYTTHNEIPEYLSRPAVADYVSPGSPVAQTGLVAGDRIVRFDKVDDPTFADLQTNGALNLNGTPVFAFLHDGQRVETHLHVESKTGPEDFSFEKLGLVPVIQEAPLEIAALSAADTPAARAGLEPKDRIMAVDGHTLHSVPALAAYLQDLAGKAVTLTVDRPAAAGSPARTFTVPVTPVLMDTQEGKAYKLGFNNTQPPVRVERLPFAAAAALSYKENVKNSRLIFEVLHRLFTRQVSVKSLSSPIGMGVMVHQAFEAPGNFYIIATMALISLNLGIFNLLPIPILDGGMILFLAIESLMRRDLQPQVKERVYQVAFVCLILFAAVVIFNDITKMLPAHIKT